jgi:predicted small metal-binding protein
VKRWTCLEAGCSREVVADDLDDVIERAQRHIADAHSGVELEDVIEAAVEDVPAGEPAEPR